MPHTQQDRSHRPFYRRNLLIRMLLTLPVVFIFVLFAPYGQRKSEEFVTEVRVATLS